ncbi:MAG: DUF4870 domain-containing protein [bacterium]
MTEKKTHETKSTPATKPVVNDDITENRAITYLSYLGILCLVPLLAKKESPFALFHAKQGLVLTIGWFVGSFLYLFFGLGFLVHIALLVFSIMGLIQVNNGETNDLPLIGEWAKKINI